MRKFGSWLVAIVASVVLSGCLATAPRGSGQAMAQDALVGGLIGFALTGDPAVTIITGVAGIVVGDKIRQNMEEQDLRRVVNVTERGLSIPNGHLYEERWVGRHYHFRSSVSPRHYVYRNGHLCRPFIQVTEIYDRHGHSIVLDRREGVACPDRRGNWVIQR